jgi:hypothetical protein
LILDDTLLPATPSGEAARPTLDGLFRRAVARSGDATALVDPPDRASFTDGMPRRLTWAQADRAVSALAARLIGLGLSTDAIVALQLPNIVESVIAVLGVLRAGMIAAPLPLLWRQAEANEALQRVGARAIITCGRVGPADHGELAMQVAAETFSVRFVCVFGGAALDGVVPLDDIFDGAPEATAPVVRAGEASAHVALVTFDVMADGLVPVARNHDELIAGGIAVALEGRIARDAAILGALTTSSFAGFAATVVPWLMTGGTLTLHQPFDPSVFAAQWSRDGTAAVLPGPLVARLAEAGLVGRHGTIIAVWRAPERLAGSDTWSGQARLVDVLSFGEIGLTAMPRDRAGKPAPVAPGPLTAPHDKGAVILDIARSAAGTLALRGAMVPRRAFPPGAERGEGPRLKANPDGFVDTGHACRLDRAGMLIIDAPPAGTVSVGGYRFVLKELQDYVAHIAEGSTLAALPDTLAGQRLAGVATDRGAIREALAAQGVNPLVVAAFRDRRGDKASAA